MAGQSESKHGLSRRIEELERENAALKAQLKGRASSLNKDAGHEAALGVILDSVEADIFAADMHTHEILYMNRHMRQTFGGDHTGALCHQALAGYDRPCPHCATSRLLDEDGHPQEPVRWEDLNDVTGCWHMRVDRAVRWPDGRLVRVQVATDITERKEAEEKYRHWLGMFENLVRASPNCIIRTDLNGHVAYISPRGARLFKAPNAFEVIGAPLLDLVAPEDRERAANNSRKILMQGLQSTGEREYLMRTFSGETFYGSVSSAVIKDAEDRPAGMISIIRDVSEKMNMELRLIRAKEDAEAASKAKSQFLANMSHEIRTPLNGILGMLQLAMLTEMDPEQREYVETALGSCNSLLKVINDVLDFSKIEAGKVEIRQEPFSLRKMLESVFGVFRNQAGARGLRLTGRVDPAVPAKVVGDEGRLRQILYNLLGNALKFTDAGEISVGVAARQGNGDGLYLDFEVADTGIGIPEDKIGHVFESFTQVDGSYTRKHQGTGLGLSIVKRLVEIMGGDIHVASRLGQGTTVRFSVRLNSERRKVTRDQAVDENLPQVSARLRLLLVEDDHVNRLTTRLFLEKFGYIVSVAANGREAVEMAREHAYDCVLMDVQMPEMDGLEAVRRIRGSEDGKTRSDVPVVAITAHAMKGDRERFLDSGMDEYVSKPLNLRELVNTLETVCGE